jgi:5-methylcytosine-specific restriction protein A
MSRAVEEWIGKTHDSAIPPRVRLRVFERDGGICRLSGLKIQPSDQWDCDHVVALINGGDHRESNLAPVLRAEHRKKTAQDVSLKAKNDRVRKKHLGIKKPRTMTRWRKMNGTIVIAGRER